MSWPSRGNQSDAYVARVEESLSATHEGFGKGCEVSILRRLVRRLAAAGVSGLLQPPGSPDYPADFSPDEIAIYEMAKPYTMTSPERVISLVRAVEYVVRAEVPGDIVECGVWRGGSMMAVIATLQRLGAPPRMLHLYDTFEGMTAPTARDYTSRDRRSASKILSTEDRQDSATWAYAPLELVRRNIGATGYPGQFVNYIRGPVEETLPNQIPELIAILRLDTDWYESTRHELVQLYPRLVSGGVLIIDDYGHWNGAREAVDEYVSENGLKLLLSRIDYTGRIAVKP